MDYSSRLLNALRLWGVEAEVEEPVKPISTSPKWLTIPTSETSKICIECRADEYYSVSLIDCEDPDQELTLVNEIVHSMTDAVLTIQFLINNSD